MRRAALFVGVNKYRDDRINDLSCAVNDAAATSAYFRTKGFETHLLTDSEVSSISVKNKIKEICTTLQAGDVFVFYFSGHGHEAGDTHYLLCPGTFAQTLNLDGGGDAIPLGVVRLLSEEYCSPGIRRLFILDCCRNSLCAGEKGGYQAVFGKGIELVEEDKGDGYFPPWILRSCQSGQRSFEDVSQGHGYFTLALEKTLGSEQVRSFPLFLETLSREMRRFIPAREQQVSLSEYPGGSFPLFDSWQSASEASVSQPEPAAIGPISAASAGELPLPVKDRVRFYTLLEECKKIYMREISPLDFPKGVQEKLSWIRRSLENLQKASLTCGTMSELEKLRSALEELRAFDLKKKQCAALNKDTDLEISFLQEAGVPLPAQCRGLKAAAQEARSRGDWETELPLLQELNRLLLEEKSKISSDHLELLQELKTAKAQGILFSADNTTITLCPGRDISGVVIPRCVTAIGDRAFCGCLLLREVIIPGSVTRIGESAFENCAVLTSVAIPESVTEIGKRAFARCPKLMNVQNASALDFSDPRHKSIFEGCRELKGIPRGAGSRVKIAAWVSGALAIAAAAAGYYLIR